MLPLRTTASTSVRITHDEHRAGGTAGDPLGGDELLDLTEEEELIQPVDEQKRAVATPQRDLQLHRLSVLAPYHELCEGVEPGGEDSDLALGRKLDLDFAAVLDEVMFRLGSDGWGRVAGFGDTSP